MPRFEHTLQCEAIILRRHDFGEADRLLTLLTPGQGKIRAIARAARKPTARATGHVELFTRAAMLLARGRELYTLSQVECREPYLALRESLERGAYAYYLAELLDRFTEAEEANPTLFALLDAALGWLCAPDADLPLVARFFEMRLLRLTGFEPSFFVCVADHEPLEACDQYYSASEGGVLCPAHRRGYNTQPLSLTALKVFRHVQRHDYKALRGLKISPALHSELERTMHSTITNLLEMRLKSADFLYRVPGV